MLKIKTFWVNLDYYNNKKNKLDEDINGFISDIANKTGSLPKIKTNSQFIAIIYNDKNLNTK